VPETPASSQDQPQGTSRTRKLGGAIRRTPLLSGLPREVAVLSAIAFFVAIGFGILAPALPIFAKTFEVSALQASAVISVFALMRFVFAPIAGILVDRMGERIVLTSGLIIVATSSVIAGFSQTYLQLVAFRGIGGIGSSMFTVSALALLLRVVDSSKRLSGRLPSGWSCWTSRRRHRCRNFDSSTFFRVRGGTFHGRNCHFGFLESRSTFRT